MLLLPNCKLNIGLRILRRRKDGYHDLQTIFYPVYGLHDELQVEQYPEHDILLTTEGIRLDCNNADNILVRCYNHLAALYPRIGGVKVTLKKNIPFGAGLGGGSSDAAHLALALNDLFDLGISKNELAKQVSILGADCAFFIYNTPCFAEGIGEILTPQDIDLGRYRLIMLKPEVGVSTRDAYAGIVPNPTPLKRHNSITDIAQLNDYTNDFETTVFGKYPVLAYIKQRLYDAGAVYASMSGSGSTMFGLFENNPEDSTTPLFRTFYEEFATMILFDNTLTHTQS